MKSSVFLSPNKLGLICFADDKWGAAQVNFNPHTLSADEAQKVYEELYFRSVKELNG